MFDGFPHPTGGGQQLLLRDRKRYLVDWHLAVAGFLCARIELKCGFTSTRFAFQMKLEYENTASMFLDQLSRQDREMVQHDVRVAADRWHDHVLDRKLIGLKSESDSEGPTFVLQVDRYRVFLRLRRNSVVVLDVVPRSQLDRLRSAGRL